MPRLIFLSMLVCLSWTNTVLASVDETPPAPDIEVIHADFGLFNPSPSGGWVLTPSAIVPLRKGQHYGWSILLKTSKPTVKWREEFTLPSSPGTWGNDESPVVKQTVSQDRLTSVVEVEAIPVEGVIENIWEVAPGDPKGHYMIRVTIEGGNPQVFEFDVQE